MNTNQDHLIYRGSALEPLLRLMTMAIPLCGGSIFIFWKDALVRTVFAALLILSLASLALAFFYFLCLDPKRLRS